jgi:putative tryptophan/tyrosine transport system substrate-binding protein
MVASLARPGGNTPACRSNRPMWLASASNSYARSSPVCAAREPNGGLIVMPDAFTETHITEIISLAASNRLPSVCPFRYWAELGGLLSYGVEQTDNFRRAATYADRILKGTKPSDLPVQGPVKLTLTINLKTAKALGLDVPWFLQQRADEVIE